MSILIKGMEMPKSCLYCPLTDGHSAECLITEKSVYFYVEKRHEDCPLVSIDVAPVVHGKWLPYQFGDYHWRQCSICGKADQYIISVVRYGFETHDLEAVRNYCPSCGARMDGE